MQAQESLLRVRVRSPPLVLMRTQTLTLPLLPGPRYFDRQVRLARAHCTARLARSGKGSSKLRSHWPESA